MDRGELAERLRHLRSTREPPLTRKQLGEVVGYRGDSAYQTVYEWETQRRGVPAELIPNIAAKLGVTICELYGVEEHPQRGQFAADQPGRIRDMVVQQLMASHNQLPEAEKKFVEDVAAAADALRQRLRREEGLGSSPTPQR